MKSKGSLVPVGLIALALGMSAGCKKKDEPPKPDPAAATDSPSGVANARRPPPPHGMMNRIDPQTMKEYRLDVCYYGTFSLRQARDVYLASLGKDEPSVKKLPAFGAPGSNLPPVAAVASAAAAPPGKAPPKPAASADAGAAPSPLDRRNELALRLPHERNARACTAATALKDPAMGDVDAQVLAFAPFASDLARDITMAQQYYQHEEYTKDGFAKGKELDKKLREGFAKLDDLSGKLGAALASWRAEHPLDTSKMEDGEKAARALIDDAREVFLLVMNHKVEGEGWKAAVDKLEKSVGALKTYADAHPADTWPKVMSAPVDSFMKTLKEAKVTPDKTFEPEAYLGMVTTFIGLIEARQRSVSRASMTHTPMVPPMSPSGAAPPGMRP